MFNRRELQVLNTIAKNGKPAISIDIASESKISQSTVQSVLRKLLMEGYVDTVGITHSSNVLSRQFIITEKAKTDIISQFVDAYKNVQNIVLVEELCQALEALKNN